MGDRKGSIRPIEGEEGGERSPRSTALQGRVAGQRADSEAKEVAGSWWERGWSVSFFNPLNSDPMPISCHILKYW